MKQLLTYYFRALADNNGVFVTSTKTPWTLAKDKLIFDLLVIFSLSKT